MDMSNEKIKEVKVITKQWQEKIQVSRKTKEKNFHNMMLKMLENPINKVFLIELLDQSFRSSNSKRVLNQLEYIFNKYDNIDFFSNFEKILIYLFRNVGIYISSISVPLFIKYLRDDISTIVLKGEDELLNQHIKKRKKENTRVNINVIGEIVLSQEEVKQRVQKYITLLQNKNIDYLSIKISNLYSQIIPHAHNNNIKQISKQLELIYREAMKNKFINKYGKYEHKFVNLDMEEYHDIRLTIDTFKYVLNKKEFKNFYAGIVIQNYLPEAITYIKELVQFSKQRVNAGGSPIKIRIVKGANQQMEETQASLKSWENVTFKIKAQCDANFKLAMNYLFKEDIAPYVHIGVASHNLFDHAYAMLLAKQNNVQKYVSAEMLEGMSEAAYEVLKDEGLNIVLYAPSATKETFTNAIAYLIRRFDENTAENNFLRYSFDLKINTPSWYILEKSYDDAIKLMPTLCQKAYRIQNRSKQIIKKDFSKDYIFTNEADTDFSLSANIKWAQDIKNKWKDIGLNGGFSAYPVINGKIRKNNEHIDVIDKSQYENKVLVGFYVMANKDDMKEAIKVAKEDKDKWRDLTYIKRQKILHNVAHELRVARADLIGIAAAEVGKVFTQTDVEVSEAIDFVNFYPYSVNKISKLNGISIKPKGVALVISPWNFPIAIPCGGVAASLAAGNTVILKPAKDSILTTYRLCQCFWDAGVSKNTLQFIPAEGLLVGKYMIPSNDIDFVILTGGENTAYNIINTKPNISLSAETGGKDATIVTSLADKEQALKNVLSSAFDNSGQKCSATSLLILEKELFDNKEYKKLIKDSVKSLKTGSVWDFSNKIATLANLPANELEKSLNFLDKNETWLVKPSFVNNNPYMLKPCVRWGTQENNFCHKNELFGPVLSVMRADDLKHAIDIVNSTEYGLTSGIESLDKREQDYFIKHILAGNLYINKPTTGAIVRRQPFGGMGKSAIGSGKKAGGYNYVSQFMDISYTKQDNSNYESLSNDYISKMEIFLNKQEKFKDEFKLVIKTIKNFFYWYEKEFLKEHDYSNIRGESNIFRYLKVKSVLLRVEQNDKLSDILSTIISLKIMNIKVHISLPKNTNKDELLWLKSNQSNLINKDDIMIQEDEIQLIKSIKKHQRIRFLNPLNVSLNIYKNIASKAIYIANNKFVAHGRIELMHYFIEQSISNSYHRYGNLGIKGI